MLSVINKYKGYIIREYSRWRQCKFLVQIPVMTKMGDGKLVRGVGWEREVCTYVRIVYRLCIDCVQFVYTCSIDFVHIVTLCTGCVHILYKLCIGFVHIVYRLCTYFVQIVVATKCASGYANMFVADNKFIADILQ
jgi:hypothetical protein